MELDTEKLNSAVEEKIKENPNKNVEEELCREVASEVNATAEECKAKWNNIKTDEAQYKKQVAVSFNEIPEKPQKEKKKKWFMSLLSDSLGANKNKNDRRSEHDSVEEEDDTDEEDGNSHGDVIANSCSYQNTKETTNKPKNIMDGKSQPISGSELHGSTVFNFFMSLLPDVKRLNAKRQRKFKFNTMKLLYELLNEEEQELGLSSKQGSAGIPSNNVLFQKCKISKEHE